MTREAGLSLVVNQCPSCGGIWFDCDALYEIPLLEAEKLDKNLISQTVRISKNLKCPRDGSFLERFIDPNISKDVYIQRCDLCGGIWLNRGELKEYKEDIQKRELEKKKYPVALSEEKMSSNNTIGRIGEFLTTPVSPYYRLGMTGVGLMKMENPDQATLPDEDAEILRQFRIMRRQKFIKA